MLIAIFNCSLMAALFRLAGSDLNIPHKKILRRVFIPIYLTLVFGHISPALILFSMGILTVILSFNLNEIELRQFDDVFNYGMAIACCLYPIAGGLSLIVPAWWITSVILSNIGIKDLKLDWRYVEIGMGIAIGLAVSLKDYF